MVSSGTYHQYQQILDFQGPEDNGVLKQRRARKKFKKSLDGCLCCKKRRKKCDEAKPICQNCTRIGLNCEWPSHVDTSASVTPKITPNVTPGPPDSNQQINSRSSQQDQNPFRINGNISKDQGADSDSTAPLPASLNIYSYSHDPIPNGDSIALVDQFLNIQMENKTENPPQTSIDIDLSKMDNMLSHIDDSIKPTNNYTIPGVVLDHDDQLCYNKFIDKFLPSITSSHELDNAFLPSTLIIPFAATSHTVREIFLACGATLLCFNKDEYQKMANDKYINCVNLLIQDLQNSPTGCEDHLFISVQLLQTLCLRDKNIGLNATKSASHLSASYEILKKRKIMTNGIPPVLDKVLCEYFVFNYPLTLMLCHHEKLSKKLVPSPFEFFDELSSFLTTDIVPNGNVWINHPMLGVSSKALEISAKTAWLCRLLQHPITQDDFNTAVDLKKMCEEEWETILQIPTETEGQIINLSFAKTHLQACFIILKKIVNWNTTIEELQPIVSHMIDEFKYCENIKDSDNGAIVSIWCLFVCGSSTLTLEQRDFLTKCFLRMAKKINSSLALKILKYFNIVWNEDLSKINHSIGFDFLFDTTVLDIVCT
ncbi:hypothetical protein BN7_5792 [Wickerhamomyces ciferrii]|uniref:Zn(2)-C6 fungal-type domain-containing protein n=1 Tax=Wickerhamomyces ciferrii (strain ATCC 14091 / BCRC 22168 / CBS 111 / JCM 3599 / NBRC 0793 / NRRL Y-1031 F-60-10) TaxID=1206466 RepID=K0KSR5_WICCF|nr:uncharacterized protein BN7_5792 [Wickerhamomyces ciferrii]CCH46201.1 hypothetical protein BN7_5792 [Wickerhamomyces ciferrii]